MRAHTEPKSNNLDDRAHRNPGTRGTGGTRCLAPFSRVLGAWRGLLVATLAVVAVGPLATAGDVAATTNPGVEVVGDLGPIASWLDDYKKGLEKANKELEDAEDAVGMILAMPDELDELVLGLHLDAAEAEIEAILDPNSSPSIAPFNVGGIDRSVQPETLQEYAEACAEMIEDALSEADSDPEGSAEFVGTQLRTILHLLPQYRAAAGI